MPRFSPHYISRLILSNQFSHPYNFYYWPSSGICYIPVTSQDSQIELYVWSTGAYHSHFNTTVVLPAILPYDATASSAYRLHLTSFRWALPLSFFMRPCFNKDTSLTSKRIHGSVGCWDCGLKPDICYFLIAEAEIWSHKSKDKHEKTNIVNSNINLKN